MVTAAVSSSKKASKKKKSSLPLVPESVLKKRHDLDELARRRAASALTTSRRSSSTTPQQQQQQQQQTKKKKAFYIKKPETLLRRAQSRRNHGIRYKRILKKGMQTRASNKPEFATKPLLAVDDDNDNDNDDGDETTETTMVKYQTNSVGAKMVFCVRIRDHVGMPKPVKKALGQLKLRHVHEGVFLRYDASHVKLLHLVAPFVVYGPPTPSVVRDLLQRRGHAKVDGGRVPIDNTVVEQSSELSEHGLLCVEDLVQELVTVGPHFTKVTSFLWPFLLSDTKTEFEKRTLKLKEQHNLGRDSYGDLGERISEYMQQVL